jgi:predicted PurR-regulated permease PerM
MTEFWHEQRRYIIFIVVSALILWVVYHWISFLLPFLLGLAFAYLFLPVVRWLERRLPPRYQLGEGKRVVSILLVFIVILGLLTFATYVSVITVANNGADLINNAAQYIKGAIDQLQRWTVSVRNHLPEGVRSQIDAFIANLGSAIGGVVNGVSLGGISMLTGSLGFVFNFAALPVFLFYILKDEESIKHTLYSRLSPFAARYTKDIVRIIEDTAGRYIRSLLILGLLVGFLALIGLLIVRMPFAIPLAVFYGFFEMVPAIGLLLGNIMLLVLTLALAPQKIVPVIVVALVVQQIENRILAPGIQGNALKLHPALILFLLVMGGVLWGFWGLVLTIPLASTLVEIFKFLKREPIVT